MFTTNSSSHGLLFTAYN